ncbi:MAG: energy-coupling factor transporter transmembrane protein EcfT [Propionibacteriaceae bacterium]|jgi:biotin transport system permease protein|nr:energy-coupling factor transporter transmembrane protein EcfT [Propionibacteriaceae bacterium]
MLSLYILGDSPIHRCPAWLKLLALALIGSVVMIIDSWPTLTAVLVLIIGAYVLARVPWHACWPMLRAMIIFVAIIAACQWLFGSAATVAVVSIRLTCVIMAANLVTWTTKVSDLVASIDVAVSPLTRLGVRTDRFSLAIALALRFIPVIAEQGRRIREAQAARGVRAPLTYLAPLIIKTVRMADGVGDALESRGADLRPVTTAGTPACPSRRAFVDTADHSG